MKKQDLKFGNVVETREGFKYLYHGQKGSKFLNLINGNTYAELSSYDDNLTNQFHKDLDIVKVYKNYTCQKLLWERPKKPVLTDDEKVILRNIDKEFKYIARDEDGDLNVYIEKPEKSIAKIIASYWRGTCKFFSYYNHLFQFIKWEDKEPYLIEDLLHE